MSHDKLCMSRRKLFRGAMQGGMTLALGSELAAVAAYAQEQAVTSLGQPAEWGIRKPENVVQCKLCPLDCILDEGKVCFCQNRANVKGRLVTLAMEKIAVLEVAAIEKGPLNHFLPGSKALALGSAGCNLRCLYCQNAPAALRRPDETDDEMNHRQAAVFAKREICKTVGFNYTEPVTYYEFMMKVSKYARKKGFKTYMASGLYVHKDPLTRMLEELDAVAGGLKGITQAFYEKVIGCDLKPVLEALVQVKESGTWLEVAHLIVPTMNDSEKDLRQTARWVKENLGVGTPLHLARFMPSYKLENLPPTPRDTLDRAYEIAKEEGLHYPYVSNFWPHPGNHTYCPKCGQIVMRRLGLRVVESNLMPGGMCTKCETQIDGVFA